MEEMILLEEESSIEEIIVQTGQNVLGQETEMTEDLIQDSDIQDPDITLSFFF